MYGQGGKSAIQTMDTLPPNQRIDYPLYEFDRTYPFRFRKPTPVYSHSEAEQNVSNMLPFQWYRQPTASKKVTPSMVSRLTSVPAFIPSGVKKANLGSS